jgi:hypothetical protein
VKREPIGSVIKGVDKLFITEESTNTDNTNNNETAITITNSNENSNANNTTPANSTNPSTVIAREKVKYVDIKTQRAYWFDSELMKTFDKEYPKKKYDKSQIMNDLLRKFLHESGKI